MVADMTNIKALEKVIASITDIARNFGLDFFPMRYEICPAEIIYTFGAYGMPGRFSHWSFGKTFYKMKLQHDFNLIRIYELVINSNPCYAFLLKENSLLQNKLIVAHVLAHSDFFKNNIYFSATSKDMVEQMSLHAERITQYEKIYGKDEVEEFIDHVLALQEHIDYRLIDSLPTTVKNDSPDTIKLDRVRHKDGNGKKEKACSRYEKDILQYIFKHAETLADWQREIILMMRKEMLYFWPQIETKVMNEGWATYWHIRIMRELGLAEEETIDFAKLNASVIQTSDTSINPYYLGLKIFEDIERRFGREKMFEVRELEGDTSFLRNYLTEKLVEELDLYVFQKQGSDWNIVDKDWEIVRDQLISARINGGFPYIVVKDGNYLKDGELYLVHYFENLELDSKYIEKTLPHVYALWGKNVYLETSIENKKVVFNYNGKKCLRRFI